LGGTASAEAETGVNDMRLREHIYNLEPGRGSGSAAATHGFGTSNRQVRGFEFRSTRKRHFSKF
jgi:hypothetical protein